MFLHACHLNVQAQYTYNKNYTERNFRTATRYFLIYLSIYDTYMTTIYTQYGKATEHVKISFS